MKITIYWAQAAGVILLGSAILTTGAQAQKQRAYGCGDAIASADIYAADCFAKTLDGTDPAERTTPTLRYEYDFSTMRVTIGDVWDNKTIEERTFNPDLEIITHRADAQDISSKVAPARLVRMSVREFACSIAQGRSDEVGRRFISNYCFKPG